MELRFHHVRDFAKDLAYVNTDDNRADPLTKPVPSPKYLQMFFPPTTKKQVRAHMNMVEVNLFQVGILH